MSETLATWLMKAVKGAGGGASDEGQQIQRIERLEL